MKILYRISDGGNAKEKLTFVYDKKRMFLHFIKIFKNHDIHVFADNVSEETYQFLHLFSFKTPILHEILY